MSASLSILIDTQAIVWAAIASPRLSAAARSILIDGANDLAISSVTAFEFVDLNRRGRFGADIPFGSILERFEMTVLPCPAELWQIADDLPRIHLDPVDRMLVAHAIHGDVTLLTADRHIRDYPVRSIW